MTKVILGKESKKHWENREVEGRERTKERTTRRKKRSEVKRNW